MFIGRLLLLLFKSNIFRITTAVVTDKESEFWYEDTIITKQWLQNSTYPYSIIWVA